MGCEDRRSCCNRCEGVTCVNEGFRVLGYDGFVDGRIANVDMGDGRSIRVEIPFDTISSCPANVGYKTTQQVEAGLHREAARVKETIIWESK